MLGVDIPQELASSNEYVKFGPNENNIILSNIHEHNEYMPINEYYGYKEPSESSEEDFEEYKLANEDNRGSNMRSAGGTTALVKEGPDIEQTNSNLAIMNKVV